MPSSIHRLNPKIQKDFAEQKDIFSKLKTANDVASLLEVPCKQLLYILYKQDDSKKYEIFEIPKKMGGVRTISKPLGSISILQSKLLPLITEKYNVKNCVHGFVKHRGILTNAISHRISQRTKILNIDIKDFYDSINFGRVRGLMMSNPFNMGKDAASVIAQILCWKNKLPQGACTSPIVSNMILHRLDSKLTKLCKSVSAYYTRYADDITISSSNPIFPAVIAIRDKKSQVIQLSNEFESIFKSENFVINYSKVRLKTNKERQEITGLTVNEFPNVRRSFIRQIRSMLHAWKKFGLEAAANEYIEQYSKKIFNSELSNPENYFKNVVYGKLAYLYMVRGKNKADIICQRFAEKILEIDDEVPNFIKVMNDSKYDMFISHASEDKLIARKIYDECTSNGIKAFFDEECINVGSSISEKINEALKSSKIFVILASYIYARKKWTCAELWSAVSSDIERIGTRIYPIVVGDINEFKRTFPLIGDRKVMIWSDNEKEITDDIKKFLPSSEIRPQ